MKRYRVKLSYYRTDRVDCGFLVNAADPDEAKRLAELAIYDDVDDVHPEFHELDIGEVSDIQFDAAEEVTP
jgi:hypothetical protein